MNPTRKSLSRFTVPLLPEPQQPGYDLIFGLVPRGKALTVHSLDF